VPWGAGLGGGSSDAASTLLALNQLWGLHWPRSRLAELGLKLGADVPFFIGGKNAFVQGVGEILQPIDLPPRLYAVVKPPASIATKELFQHPALKRDTEPLQVAAILPGCFEMAPEAERVRGNQQTAALWGRNDLQAAAESCCPEIKTVAEWLCKRFGNSRMTGSGSAVFAAVSNVEGGETAATTRAILKTEGTSTDAVDTRRSIRAEPSLAGMVGYGLPCGWVGRLCSGLQQHPLWSWAA
jgi:4-diphosphocytidyl-2-C-methyl-D-erythritol kinase